MTALVVQNYLGGEFLRATVEDASHYRNRLSDGTIIRVFQSRRDPAIHLGELSRLWVAEHTIHIQHGAAEHPSARRIPSANGPRETAGLVTDDSQRAAFAGQGPRHSRAPAGGCPHAIALPGTLDQLSGDVRELHATDVKGNNLADVVEQRNGFSCSIVSDAATGQAFDQLISVQCPSPLTVGPSAMPGPVAQMSSFLPFFLGGGFVIV